MTFDLEKAREAVHILENFAFASGKITTGQIQDILWGARQLAWASTEIEQLREANTNFACQACDQAQEIERLRATVEGYEIDIASFLSDRQVSSEIIRELRAKKDENALIEAIEEHATRIKELEELNAALMKNESSLRAAAGKYRKRAQVEEAALKEEKAWTNQYQKWLIEEVAEGMSENGFADDDLRQRARDSLLLDGKIGADASKPRSWQITDERKAAIKRSAELFEEDASELEGEEYSGAYTARQKSLEIAAVLRAMLEEPGACYYAPNLRRLA